CNPGISSRCGALAAPQIRGPAGTQGANPHGWATTVQTWVIVSERLQEAILPPSCRPGKSAQFARDSNPGRGQSGSASILPYSGPALPGSPGSACPSEFHGPTSG